MFIKRWFEKWQSKQALRKKDPKAELLKEEQRQMRNRILAALGGVAAIVSGNNLPPEGMGERPVLLPGSDHEVILNYDEVYGRKASIIPRSEPLIIPGPMTSLTSLAAESIHDALEGITDDMRKQQESTAEIEAYINQMLAELRRGVSLPLVDKEFLMLRDNLVARMKNGESVDEAFENFCKELLVAKNSGKRMSQ